jgi:hypothetical protein
MERESSENGSTENTEETSGNEGSNDGIYNNLFLVVDADTCVPDIIIKCC